MSPKPNRRPGLVLLVAGIAVTLSLALSGRLEWYIHPRSVTFTIVMVSLAGVAWCAACAVRGSAQPRHTLARQPRGWRRPLGTVLALCCAGAVVLLPPATLSPEAVAQRAAPEAMGLGIGPETAAGTADLAQRDDGELTIRQWALLVRGADSAAITGRAAELVGFITPDADDPESLFVVTRYAITCCAVDAQAVGVPVYRPGWQAEFAPGDWVQTTGVFAANPSVTSRWAAVLLPARMAPTAEPEDPYVS